MENRSLWSWSAGMRIRAHNAIDPVNEDFRIWRKRFVRDGLPEFPAMHHVAFLARLEAIFDDCRLSRHLSNNGRPMPDLLHLVHGEQEEASEKSGRNQQGGEEEHLIVRRDGEPRWAKGCQEGSRKNDGSDPANPEHAETGRLDFEDDQYDAHDEEEQRNRIDAEAQTNQGEKKNDDPRNLRPVAWRRDAEDHEVDPEDEQEGRDEGIREQLKEPNARRWAERIDRRSRRAEREILEDRLVFLNKNVAAVREGSVCLRTLRDQFRRAELLRTGVVEVQVVNNKARCEARVAAVD